MESTHQSIEPDGVAGHGLEIVLFQRQTEQDLSSEYSAKQNMLSLVPSLTTTGTRRPTLSRAGRGACSQKLTDDDDAVSAVSSPRRSDIGTSAPLTPTPLQQHGDGDVRTNIFEITCQVKGCEVRMLRQPTRPLVCNQHVRLYCD